MWHTTDNFQLLSKLWNEGKCQYTFRMLGVFLYLENICSSQKRMNEVNTTHAKWKGIFAWTEHIGIVLKIPTNERRNHEIKGLGATCMEGTIPNVELSLVLYSFLVVLLKLFSKCLSLKSAVPRTSQVHRRNYRWKARRGSKLLNWFIISLLPPCKVGEGHTLIL